MKSRFLLAVLVGIFLVLAVMIYERQAINPRLEQSLTMLDDLPKTELDRFHSNAMEFYQHSSKAAQEERKRLRTIFYQIQHDPESERLMKTMGQYVDWVGSFNDPARLRELQRMSIEARVETVHAAVQRERQTDIEPPLTFDRLKENLRDNLAPKLREVSLLSLAETFDTWLTQEYAEAKAGLTEEQLHQLPFFEKFYREMFRSAGMETSSAETLELPEKLTMLQLIQNLNLTPRSGGGGLTGFPRMGGGPRLSGGGFFVRPGSGTPFVGGGMRENLYEQLEQILLDHIAESSRQTLDAMNRSTRTETLQRMLALAVLERYPSVDQGRFFQAISRTDQQEWIKVLGVYLSIMSPSRREEFLRQDSRSTLNRLQGELWFNAMAYFGMFRTRLPDNRPPGIGQPPPPGMGQPPPPGMGPPPPPPDRGPPPTSRDDFQRNTDYPSTLE